MERPTWATVIGILGIIFGCIGFLGAGQEILMPKMLKFQKQIISEIEESSNQSQSESSSDQGADTQQDTPSDPFKLMQKMMDLPEWFQSWSIFSGIAKALISGLFIFASILLLQTKSLGIRMFYWVAGSSILLTIVKSMLAVMASAFIGISMIFGGLFSSIIDIALIIVVATGNKEAFYQIPPPLNR